MVSLQHPPQSNDGIDQSSFRKYIDQFQVALDDEIRALRNSGGQRTHLTSGTYLSRRSSGKYLYGFVADSEIRFQDETPIELELRNRRKSEPIKGILVSVDGFDVTLALEEKIGKKVSAATLNTSPIFLLEALKGSFEQTKNQGTKANIYLANLLLDPVGIPAIDCTGNARKLLTKLEERFNQAIIRNSSQERAVEQVLTNRISFIWGPPGTGKTTTLGMTVAALTQAGESVLILSHSNMAVDTAMVSTAKYLEVSGLYKEGYILRHGVPVPKLLDDYPKLRAKRVLKYLEPEFIERIDILRKKRKEFYQQLRNPYTTEYHKRQIIQDLELVEKQLEPLKQQLKQKEKQLIVRAEVVGCTLSKAAIAEEVQIGKFDAVIVDEASMISIPQCVFASLFAKRRIAIYGDFRQLGPIAQSETPAAKKWLSRDIFEQAGITQQVDRNAGDSRMVMLQTQYRMHPQIASIPNRLCYNQRLQNGPNVEYDNTQTVEAHPFSSHAVAIQDLSALKAECTKETESHSRFNLISALVTTNAAYQAVQANESNTIGIITPYSAQSRLIHRMIRDLKQTERIKASTVHRFQGSECSIILFDVVDGYPQKNIGLPLQGNRQSTAMRLANVAISRAKGKFIGVMNLNYVRQKLYQAQFSAFRRFTEYLHNQAYVQTLDTETFIGTHMSMPGVIGFTDATEARTILEEDLLKTMTSVAIYWPIKTFADHFSPEILTTINQQGVGFYISGLQGAEANLDLTDIQIWNNGQCTTTGFLGIDEKDLWIFLDPSNPKAAVLKLNLPKTNELLYSFLRLIPHRKTLPDSRYPFGQCKTCNEPMWFHTIGQASFITCIKHPGHTDHDSRRVQPSDAERLAEQTKQTCGKCGFKLIGRRNPRNDQMLLVCSQAGCNWTMKLTDLI